MIKVQAKDPNGKLKWIQIVRGEGDNGNIAIIGKSGGAPELSYDLLDIRRRSQTEFVCKADGPGWIDPEISCRSILGPRKILSRFTSMQAGRSKAAM